MLNGLDAGDVTKIGAGIIIALVVIGILVGLLITKIIGRLVIAVIVIGLAVFVWQQRSSVETKVNHEKNHVCNSFNATFFGVHLDAPDSVKKKCRHLG